ncbi:hypothetical protein L2Y96_18195 [Luteibacter aegosomaticola]|uniref:hypothetical protein n=1 Tax=Luteibacter aegosomaticola TaxID=2911538 RepID=UPI001FF7386E|nr:hypothetical protein [Luteibacter aegosomaticola]UPG89310.1 hypothetical protein L2Y96_18195 [Luteibacter aegosomaticola]
MKQVIVFPRGQLSPEDRRHMYEAGFVAVEADDPSKVVLAVPLAVSAPTLGTDELTMALLHAVGTTTWEEPKRLFAEEMHRRAVAREKSLASSKTGD